MSIYKMDRIEVVKHGPFYRAETSFSIYPNSPYRAMWSSRGKAVSWGRSAESAAARCERKASARLKDDQRLYEERKARTTYFPPSR